MTIPDQLDALLTQAREIWLTGGWAMIAIATTAFVMFGMGMHVFLQLRSKGFRSVPETTWRRWIAHPAERRGPIGSIIATATAATTLDESVAVFDRIRKTEVVPFERDLLVMKICVGAAPLLGLLGTVTGMLTTFGALATGSGGEQTMALVAGGISEALVTTETGLVIALPGLFFHHQLTRTHQRYKAFLAHVETVCAQSLYRRLRRRAA